MMLPSIVMSLGVILIGQSPTGPTCPVTIPEKHATHAEDPIYGNYGNGAIWTDARAGSLVRWVGALVSRTGSGSSCWRACTDACSSCLEAFGNYNQNVRSQECAFLLWFPSW